MFAPIESPFCDTCQRNQLLLNKALAEYIPDEDDPEYEKYANTVDEYRAQLEERYPQVCEDCIDRVQDQIRAAGYAAKADNLRRVLEQSQKYQTKGYTPRQMLTLTIIWFAKWTYIFSVVVGLLWHGFGSIVSTDIGFLEVGNFGWWTCMQSAAQIQRVNADCVLSPFMLRLVKAALTADVLTIWWNPKLAKKTNRAGGRMHGLGLVWCIRAVALASRLFAYGILTTIDGHPTNLRFYQYTHMALFVILLGASIAGWTSVRIVYQSTKSLMQPLDAHLPSAPQSAEKPKQSMTRKPLPNNSSFDTMAQSFTSSFPGRDESNMTLPPSPTLTSMSTSTQDSEFDSPYKRKKTPRADDAMDWTPTQKRFADHAPSVIPSQWSSQPALSPPATKFATAREPISIFSKPDPNPFRHRIPAAPKAPATSLIDPWKPGVWAPPLKETTTNFFKEVKGKDGREGGLQGVGVPRNVRRDAELFQSPRLKYDFFGEMKEAGLEDTFNGLFSK